MGFIILVSIVSALRVKVVNNLPTTGSCPNHNLNIFLGNDQTNINPQPGQNSKVLESDAFGSMGGVGIQVDVMTWSYDFDKDDGSTFQCTDATKNECNNPDNSSLNLWVLKEGGVCSWKRPCGYSQLTTQGFCKPWWGYGVPTNGFTTISVTNGSGDHDCVVTVSPQTNGNWDYVCKTIAEPQSWETPIPSSAAMYFKDHLKSDIRTSLPTQNAQAEGQRPEESSEDVNIVDLHI